MSPTSKSEEKETKKEEAKSGGRLKGAQSSLAVGHPSTGYTSPDPRFVDGIEKFPEQEQAARDEMVRIWEEERDDVEKHEHDFRVAEVEQTQKLNEEEQKRLEKESGVKLPEPIPVAARSGEVEAVQVEARAPSTGGHQSIEAVADPAAVPAVTAAAKTEKQKK